MLWLHKWRRGHVLSSSCHRTCHGQPDVVTVYLMCLALPEILHCVDVTDELAWYMIPRAAGRVCTGYPHGVDVIELVY